MKLNNSHFESLKNTRAYYSNRSATTLKAQNVFFRGYSAASNWADKKNLRARKYIWRVKAIDGGYIAYKTKLQS